MISWFASFGEFLALEELTPERAFVQTNGFIPVSKSKIDYAFYIGNSPNVNDNPNYTQTGIDTTNTLLYGGRIGFRISDFKLGISATYDKTNAFKNLEPLIGVAEGFLEKVQRMRVGGDLSYDFKSLRFEGEFIKVNYDDDVDELKFDKWFYYYTLGYFIDEEVFLYYSYWLTDEYYNYSNPTGENLDIRSAKVKVIVPTIGLSYHMTERITFKGQFAQVKIHDSQEFKVIENQPTENTFSLAVSVFF